MDVSHCKPPRVNRDRGVPVGLFAGADDVDDTYAVAGGVLLVPEPELPIMLIRLARILAIISAATFEFEPDVLGGGYRFHGSSGNHKFAEALTHSHRIPTIHTARLALIYCSLRNWRSKRDGWGKKNNSQNEKGTYFGSVTHWKTERKGQRTRRLKRKSASLERLCGV